MKNIMVDGAVCHPSERYSEQGQLMRASPSSGNLAVLEALFRPQLNQNKVKPPPDPTGPI